MANVIQIKRSASTSVPTTLAVGELAYSSFSDKLFIGEAGSVITEIAGGAFVSKLNAIDTGATDDQTGAEIKALYEAETNAFTDALFTKLATIDTSAADDQTGAEIKALYEAEASAFTDALFTKLNAIETGATADQTGAEIKVAYESENDTNAYTDSEKTKLTNIEIGADVTDATNVAAAGAVMESDTTTALMQFVIDEDSMATDTNTKVPTQQSVKAYVDDQVALSLASGVRYQGAYDASTNSPDLDSSPIANITTGDMYTVTAAGTFFSGVTLEIGDVLIAEVDAPTVVADWTVVQANLDNSSIKTKYEANANTNAYADVDVTKLAGIEVLATADQTGSEIKGLYEAEADTNGYTDAEKSKLNLIEVTATADQTDAEIRAAVEAATDSNVFTDADHSHLDAIEALADVTDATNVAAAITAVSPMAIDASANLSVDSATTTAEGVVQIATQAEVDAGTDALKPVTALTLATTVLDGGSF